MTNYALSGVPRRSVDNDVDGSHGVTLVSIDGGRDGHGSPVLLLDGVGGGSLSSDETHPGSSLLWLCLVSWLCLVMAEDV